MAEAARRCGIRIVGGDTKVVEHGKADGMFNTYGGNRVIDMLVGDPLPRIC